MHDDRQLESSAARDRASRAALPRWLWALVGGAIGLFDFGVLLAFDADLRIGGQDATAAMALLFFLPYAALGWAVGGLVVARRRAERDRETIARQLAALERSQHALVQEEKLAGIGRLAAGVAHEVRNPLGVIRAAASMAQDSFDPESDPHRALGFVCEETDRLDRLIGSLLTFAKPQRIECEWVEVEEVIDRVLDLARPLAEERAIALGVELAPGLPPLFADPDRLSQALFGLTLNGMQVLAGRAEDGDARVLVRGDRTSESIRLEVLDSGPDIPRDLREQVFEPFVTTRESGTGLGLPMALRMVEAQGGTLTLVESLEPDRSGLRGAHFVVEMPIAPQPEEVTT